MGSTLWLSCELLCACDTPRSAPVTLPRHVNRYGRHVVPTSLRVQHPALQPDAFGCPHGCRIIGIGRREVHAIRQNLLVERENGAQDVMSTFSMGARFLNLPPYLLSSVLRTLFRQDNQCMSAVRFFQGCVN